MDTDRMDATLRTVTRLPLEKLWRRDGTAVGSRLRMLNPDEVLAMLRQGSIEFVVADVGQGLRWVGPQDCFDFWKTEVKPHLAKINSQIMLDSFPDAYCYTASEWDKTEGVPPIVLLERYH
jgi:hypothetical protein